MSILVVLCTPGGVFLNVVVMVNVCPNCCVLWLPNNFKSPPLPALEKTTLLHAGEDQLRKKKMYSRKQDTVVLGALLAVTPTDNTAAYGFSGYAILCWIVVSMPKGRLLWQFRHTS